MGRHRKLPNGIIQLDFFELTDHITLKTKPYWIPQYVEDADGRVTTGYAEIISSRVVRRQPRPFDKPIPRRLDMITFPVPKGKKWCPVCGEWMAKRNFSPKADTHDGLHPYCKPCRAEHARKMYWAAKESVQLAAVA
jgi:hypothetical protein